ncbi:hypothetical protein LIER_02459 [Lithospermum erythrorhizon]|uniref:Retrotransposon gag domain-containing protein n=1 Tax=Lithospermum erythrorhizon TaxID=34254 RepID=A0AAV3NU74_LITER
MMPRGFRMPKFKTFSGSRDPGNHLKPFDSRLSFWASDDEVYAWAFPSSLLGQALNWFHKLPPDSIDCWQHIVDLFMDKFRASIVADEDKRTLMDIQQKPGETLRSFATRFEEVATNIPTANEKVTMISFFHGLRYGPLKEKLVLEPPNTRNELFKLVIQYIKLEEVKLLSEEYLLKVEGSKPKDEVRQKSPKRARVWDRLQRPKERETFKRQGARSPRREDERQCRVQYHTFYTPLQVPVGRIYAQLENKRILSKPQKIKSPPNRRDEKNYCEYHKDYGHDTDECRLLKAEIEKLIRRGQLKEFVRRDQGSL